MKYILKIIALMLITQISTLAIGKQYIMVAVSGFGTRRPDRPWQPSGVHERIPVHADLVQSYELVHYAKKNELEAIVEEFQCRDGKKGRDLGLIITANSWGSSKAYKLAKLYQKKCSDKADLFYVIDGVAKPIGAFGKTPPAKKCFSFYQRKGLVRGKAIDGCLNEDYTSLCKKRGLGPVQCHIHVEWEGASRARSEIIKFLGW